MNDEVVYFQSQKTIYPRSVKGRYRSLKWFSTCALLGIYYFVPWIRWDRGPHAPDQAVLIDMPARRAYFFNIELWPQEIYFFAGLMVLAAIGLFFVTSLFGRVWCGYACPQTVWSDLFVAVEKFVQGDRNERMKLDNSPMCFTKAWKKTLTHAMWLMIAFCTGGAWVFYFVDAHTLIDHLRHFSLTRMEAGWMFGLTLSTYVMAGYAREQVCTYMCPYSRFQSAMFDRDTLIIGYDRERGEPRGKHKQGTSWEGKGHCIDCTQCVMVCPMGIDIRNGLQMECIACGLCVDACNDVMDRMELPRGLIRYDTQNNYEKRTVAKATGAAVPGLWASILRPRTYYYATLIVIIGGVLGYNLLNRSAVELTVIHDRNPLFVKMSDGSIRNTYTLRIANKTHKDQTFSLLAEGIEVSKMQAVGAGEINTGALHVLADSTTPFRVMLYSSGSTNERTAITLSISNGILSDKAESVFMSEGK